MSNIIEFRVRPLALPVVVIAAVAISPDAVWLCECECQQFYLHVNGSVECVGCGVTHTSIGCFEFDPDHRPCGA
jgi:hypothetical protein